MKNIMEGLEKKLNFFTNALMVGVSLTPKARESQVAPLIMDRSGENAAFQNVVRVLIVKQIELSA